MLRSKEINYVIVVFGILLIMAIFTSLGCTTKGENGSDGSQGLRGDTGAPGLTGPTGPAAPITAISITPLAPGMDCSQGGSLITIGTSDTIICNGENGTDGTDASIQFITFCKGSTTTYPSTFAEVGLCVSGALYGVYSANGGFLVHMPPGAYSSNGINSSCTFTVVSGCTIQ